MNWKALLGDDGFWTMAVYLVYIIIIICVNRRKLVNIFKDKDTSGSKEKVDLKKKEGDRKNK